ncbi:MAG: ATP-binding protein [Candidatus Tectimicrobiota bacterium]
MADDRHIQISGDAAGNTVITGDGNVVIIQTTRVLAQEHRPASSAIGPNPYQGLAAFTEKEADRFCGRETLTQKLWEVFRALHEPSPGSSAPLRLLPILGPSGCGKSSLVRAGLLPALARQVLPGLRQPRVVLLTPGTQPLEELARVLACTATDDPAPAAKTREFAEELRQPGVSGAYDGLRRIAAVLPGIAASPLIVLVDQYEELYALCEDTEAQNVFVANLLHAAADRAAHVSVILTLRSDFLGQTQRHTALNQAIAARGVIVPAMQTAELRRAIAEPAARAGHPFDPATVELLLADITGHEGALPLLQFALTRIWEGLAAGVTPADTLRDIGGVGGALAGEAQRLYDSLGASDQAIARRAFLGLVRLGEGVRDTRRRIAVADLVAYGEDADHVRQVLRLFSRPSARLITFAAAVDGTDTAEITHEALFEHWETLQTWLAHSRADLRLHRRSAPECPADPGAGARNTGAYDSGLRAGCMSVPHNRPPSACDCHASPRRLPTGGQ